jgi:hypothetical protein
MNLSLSLVYFTVLSARTIQHEMTDWWTGKDMEGRSHSIIEVQSQHLLEGTDKNHEKTQDSWDASWKSKQAPSEHKSKMLSLHLPAVSFHIILEDILPRWNIRHVGWAVELPDTTTVLVSFCNKDSFHWIISPANQNTMICINFHLSNLI